MRTSNNEMSSESSPAWMLALPSRKRMSSKYGWECFSKFQMRLCSSKRSQNFSSARSSEMDSRKARVGFGDMVPLAAETVRVSPGPFEGEPPGMGGNELMDGVRSPRTRGVEANRRRGLEQCARRRPQPFDPVGGREQRPIAAHRIENQALIGLEDVADKASVAHRELQTQFIQSHSRTGSLAVKRKRHL